MILIPLTQNKSAIVDNDSYGLVGCHKWYAYKRKGSNTYYAQTNINKDGRRQTLRMHWLIMDTKGIDHINHNGLDNRKENLRLCNQSQNTANSRKRKIKTSKFKGVYKKGNRYIASIRYLDKRYELGSFRLEKNAALAYDRKAEKLFGVFACFNFPDTTNKPSIEKKIRGDRNKLTTIDIYKIKQLLKNNIPTKKIADMFTVSVQTIYNIKNGKKK